MFEVDRSLASDQPRAWPIALAFGGAGATVYVTGRSDAVDHTEAPDARPTATTATTVAPKGPIGRQSVIGMRITAPNACVSRARGSVSGIAPRAPRASRRAPGGLR